MISIVEPFDVILCQGEPSLIMHERNCCIGCRERPKDAQQDLLWYKFMTHDIPHVQARWRAAHEQQPAFRGAGCCSSASAMPELVAGAAAVGRGSRCATSSKSSITFMLLFAEVSKNNMLFSWAKACICGHAGQLEESLSQHAEWSPSTAM